MNEEELKKGCGKRQGRGLNFYICGHLLLNEMTLEEQINEQENMILKAMKVLCPTCQARLEGFQKGKLEQKKEELKVIENIRWICARLQFKDISFELEDIYRECTDRIKQLQKEIGEMK